ncbi:hypothetical protein [Deinococcus soli (ex Cha et al. 2016)]|uniref:Uncharacterized protein n=2 Tax=Deinococcus soli (ex Cha et al. 2016) TaxID=1309411 RepID=A0ACC6KGV3_9DEIO|nr:hypothetical protein [Deinococcus soli (ex Cha et al. 2016)]MDR6218114.1 hypothetical protein [Deinococcus soli (ex Cha et al. 2016)]MDR6328854.1 hypothetical protein [Deinococcus soli (ex Cha et al. 2016)]MDR6751658.1 hypothetical protein [Deinococcus soli (ex Cha et al. 2016)]
MTVRNRPEPRATPAARTRRPAAPAPRPPAAPAPPPRVTTPAATPPARPFRRRPPPLRTALSLSCGALPLLLAATPDATWSAGALAVTAASAGLLAFKARYRRSGALRATWYATCVSVLLAAVYWQVTRAGSALHLPVLSSGAGLDHTLLPGWLVASIGVAWACANVAWHASGPHLKGSHVSSALGGLLSLYAASAAASALHGAPTSWVAGVAGGAACLIGMVLLDARRLLPKTAHPVLRRAAWLAVLTGLSVTLFGPLTLPV